MAEKLSDDIDVQQEIQEESHCKDLFDYCCKIVDY